MLIQPQIRTHKCFSVSLQSLWQTHTSVCWCAAEFKPTRTHTSPEIFWSNRVAINALTWQLCAACKKWKRDSFHAWPHGIGLSGWYSASCFCWENTRGIFGCLLISSESRAGRRGTHTSMPLWSDFPTRTHMHTHTHSTHTHAKLPPFTRAYLFLVVCILLLSWRWHTYAHAHTHKCAHVCAPTLTQESFMLPSKSLFS